MKTVKLLDNSDPLMKDEKAPNQDDGAEDMTFGSEKTMAAAWKSMKHLMEEDIKNNDPFSSTATRNKLWLEW